MSAPQVSATGALAQLNAAGVTTVLGTVVNPAGLTHVKAVPPRRVAAFVDPGLGASPVWHGFTVDTTGIAFTEGIGVVGDHRIRLDLAALHTLGDGLAWAPGSFYDQAGAPVGACTRGTLARVVERLADAELTARVGHEMEFVLVGPDGGRLPSTSWAQYGLAGVLEHEAFVRDVLVATAEAGVAVEQFHPEYGVNQFEISLAPLAPVAAADALVLARLVVSRVARRHGVKVSLSPVPFAGGVGSGAHQHVSLARGGAPLFSGGGGAHGMTAAGESAMAGLLDGLGGLQGITAGSVLSGVRLQPGMWAGAWRCWGTENREAAVRFLPAGGAQPQGAHVEVKIVDPSANPYLATAGILALALDGVERGATLPTEVTVDPASLTDEERTAAGAAVLPTAQAEVLDALAGCAPLRAVLGDAAVDAVVAVRRYEIDAFAELTAEQLTDRLRMAWSL